MYYFILSFTVVLMCTSTVVWFLKTLGRGIRRKNALAELCRNDSLMISVLRVNLIHGHESILDQTELFFKIYANGDLDLVFESHRFASCYAHARTAFGPIW